MCNNCDDIIWYGKQESKDFNVTVALNRDKYFYFTVVVEGIECRSFKVHHSEMEKGEIPINMRAFKSSESLHVEMIYPEYTIIVIVYSDGRVNVATSSD